MGKCWPWQLGTRQHQKIAKHHCFRIEISSQLSNGKGKRVSAARCLRAPSFYHKYLYPHTVAKSLGPILYIVAAQARAHLSSFLRWPIFLTPILSSSSSVASVSASASMSSASKRRSTSSPRPNSRSHIAT